MGRHGQTGSKTTLAVIKARTRKRHNRALRAEQLKIEAARLGITVMQLVGKKAQEVAKIIKARRFYSPPPKLRPSWDPYGW